MVAAGARGSCTAADAALLSASLRRQKFRFSFVFCYFNSWGRLEANRELVLEGRRAAAPAARHVELATVCFTPPEAEARQLHQPNSITAFYGLMLCS